MPGPDYIGIDIFRSSNGRSKAALERYTHTHTHTQEEEEDSLVLERQHAPAS